MTSRNITNYFNDTTTSENTRHSTPTYNRSTSKQQVGNDTRNSLFHNDSKELYAVTGGVMAAVGISSVFSRNTRATMLLILPGSFFFNPTLREITVSFVKQNNPESPFHDSLIWIQGV